MSDLKMPSSDARQPVRVMIIEDEVIVAMDIAASVEAGGGKVVACAATAREAAEVAQEIEIDLLLSDVRLADDSDGNRCKCQDSGAVRCASRICHGICR